MTHKASQIARCEEEREGNVLGWSSQRWNTSGEVTWAVRRKEDICSRQRRRVTFFPDRFSLKASLHLCKVHACDKETPFPWRGEERNDLTVSTDNDTVV